MKTKTVNLCTLIASLICLGLSTPAQAAGSKTPVFCETPPLGYNSFDSYNCHIYEEVAMKEIDAFIEKFAPHGYEYFVIDNGWFSSPKTTQFKGYMVPVEAKAKPEDVSVDESGIVQPSKLFFPNGLKPMIEKLHAKGLKFGVHLMRGIPRVAVERKLPIKGTKYSAADVYTTSDDCTWCTFMHGLDMTKPGAQEYLNSVFNQFAAWGIDFVKVDHVTHFPAEIEGYAKAIAQCGRPMVLSLSAGGTSNLKYLDSYRKTQMVRTTPDIWDNPVSLERSFESMRKWQGLEYPGFWPDLDMIPFGELCILSRPEVLPKPTSKSDAQFMGHMHHWCHLTETQKDSFITQRAIAASPIMIGGSMISMDAHSLKLLTNEHMLACVKNGVHGRLMEEANDLELWAVPTANKARQGFTEYTFPSGWIAVFNRADQPQTFSMRGRFSSFLPKGTFNFTDVWGKQSVKGYKKGTPMNLEIAPHGVVFMRYSGVD
jgi:hypothetical protein